MNRNIKIATRKSPLALYQAEFVKKALLKKMPDLAIELKKITTEGDKKLKDSLSKYGGKGLFIKELEQAMLQNRADLAVHSMKDMTVLLPPKFTIAACCERHDPRDAFISNHYTSLVDLPKGAVVGTSSLRRQSQILALRPDLKIKLLRGNVGTRLKKLDDGKYDAIVLAAAGLIRLEKSDRITAYLSFTECLPAVGQGVIGIECREDDAELLSLLAFLNHDETAICLSAERAMNKKLEGGCQVPIAGYAFMEDGTIFLEGKVASPDGKTVLQSKAKANLTDAENLGKSVAEDLLAQGAKDIIDNCYDT